MSVELNTIAGGALKEQFQECFSQVMDNLQDVNTPYKDAREINIKLKFKQNEARNAVAVDIAVTKKLAGPAGTQTVLYTGKDLRTGEVIVNEMGHQIPGQQSISDYAEIDGKEVDTTTGEIKGNKIVDMRKRTVAN